MGKVQAERKRAIAGPRKLRPKPIRKSSTVVKMGSVDLFGRRVQVNRHSARADARRERERQGRHSLTAKAEREHWAQRERDEREDRHRQIKEWRAEKRRAAGPRHFYGAWTPWAVDAVDGGHPGRALRRAHRHVRRHARRILKAKII